MLNDGTKAAGDGDGDGDATGESSEADRSNEADTDCSSTLSSRSRPSVVRRLFLRVIGDGDGGMAEADEVEEADGGPTAFEAADARVGVAVELGSAALPPKPAFCKTAGDARLLPLRDALSPNSDDGERASGDGDGGMTNSGSGF